MPQDEGSAHSTYHDRRQKLVEWFLQRLPLFFVAFLVLYPISMLFYGSFWSSTRITSPGHLTFNNFIGVFKNPLIIRAILNTFWVTLGTTAISVLMGVPLAWLVARTNMPGRSKVRTLTLLPFFTSSLLVGISWALLLSPQIGLINNVFSAMGIARLNIFSLGGLIWATGLYHVPYMFLFAYPAFQSVDASLEESSQILGSQCIYDIPKNHLSSHCSQYCLRGHFGSRIEHWAVWHCGHFGNPEGDLPAYKFHSASSLHLSGETQCGSCRIGVATHWHISVYCASASLCD